jgi:hypothetical protein
LLGGLLTGALAGLKADLLTGGLTMGAGALAGGVLGAMGAAGVARGLNIVRGTEHSYATWNDEAMTAITEALLLRTLTGPFGLAEAEARTRLAAALAPQQAVLARLWQGRSSKAQASGAAEVAAAILQPLLSRVTQDALR